jgi:hypothetical protein
MPFLTSIAGSGTGQYVADENGTPWLLRGDTVWSLICLAGQAGGGGTWQYEMDTYVTTRAGQGYNTLFATPTGTVQINVATDGSTWDGVAPFTSPGVMNDPFWQRVDYLITSAQNSGMSVILNAMFTYAITQGGGPLDTTAWSNTQYGNYGTALGTRYSGRPNLAWEVGDDYTMFGENYDAHFDAFLTGLRGAGDAHFISIENNTQSTSRKSVDLSTTYAWGTANAQYQWCYDYRCAYLAVEAAYVESSPIPVLKMDGYYDGQGAITESDELFMRKWAWWSLSSGARGTLYGDNVLHKWPTNALSLLTSNPFSATSLPAIWNAFSGLQGWNRLVPDTSSALVTAGRGTRDTPTAPSSSPSVYLGGNTYVTASKTADNTLAVIYIPSNVTVTVNGGLLNPGYGAKWIDPASGAQTTATIASTYNNASANSAGDNDWVLVLASPPYATWTVP